MANSDRYQCWSLKMEESFQNSRKVGGCKQIEKLENVDSLVVFKKKHRHLDFAPVRFTVVLATS